MDGLAVIPADIALTQVSTSSPKVTLDPVTGAITVATVTPPGTYTVIYSICEKLNPTNCSTATATITVTPFINPVTESGTKPATGGTAITNVASNDMVNGEPAILVGSTSNATVSMNGIWPSGITLDPSTGAINVAVGTVPGTYPVTYQLCDKLTPQNCATMIDMVTVTASTDLSVVKTVDIAAPKVGQNVTFTITAKNNGPSDATAVIVKDVLPTGYTLVSAVPSIGTWTAPNWTIGSMSNGTTATLIIVAQVKVTGTYANTATIAGGESDPGAGNNSSTVIPIPEAVTDLSVVKNINKANPNVGDIVIFTISATNNGPSDATGVSLSDILPAGYTFVSATPSVGTWTTPIWTIGNLGNGITATLAIAAKVNDTGTYANTATLTGGQLDPTPANNASTVTPVVNHFPTANNDAITLVESGSVTGNASGNDHPSVDGGNVWTKATNPLHGTVTVKADGTYTYTPTPGYSGSDSFTYTITDANGDKSTATVIITVTPLSTYLLVNKHSSNVVQNSDGTFSMLYTLTLTNKMNAKMDSIHLTDDLTKVFTHGEEFTVTGITASGNLTSNGLYDGSSNINTISLTKVSYLAPNSSDSIMITLKINAHNYIGNIDNQATFDGTSSVIGKINNVYSDDPTNNGAVYPRPTVTEIPEIELVIPHAFSPNQDGHNDTYVVLHSNLLKLKFEVFNRWGNRVYLNNDYQNEWDGKGVDNFLGKDLPNGTYYYIIITTHSETNVVKKYSGYITLRR